MTAEQTPEAQPSIALIGYRGSGKTAVGRKLVNLLGGELVDSDHVIAKQAGKTIAEIFTSESESGFRKRERDAIAQIVMSAPQVISVGGGAVLDAENVKALRSVAKLVWLSASAEVLWQRIRADDTSTHTRPALTDRTGIEEVEHLLAQRSSVYKAAADHVVNTENRNPSEIAKEIASRLGRTTT